MSYTTRPRSVAQRSARKTPSGCAVLAVCLIVVMLLLSALIWDYAHDMPTEAELRPARTHDSLAPTYTYDGQLTIRWYVFTDPDTGVQYLVNDLGGCTPRLDQSGEPMGIAVYTYD